MPHPVAVRGAVLGVLEREEAGRGEDLRPADDHRAVVQRRADHEDGGEELGREAAVHRHAGLGVVLQPRRSLDHDEGAVPGAADEERRSGELVHDAVDLFRVARRQQPVQGTELPELSEAAP